MYPSEFQNTWSALLDPENWKNLKTNPKKVTHLRSKMRDLVKKFAGDDINSFLFLEFPKIQLEDPVMERLKNLCNELEKQVKAKNASREINNIYTNIISCIVQFKNEIGKRVEYQDFVKAGWKFGVARNTSARKRQREETYCDITPSKRGRKRLPAEVQEKARQ